MHHAGSQPPGHQRARIALSPLLYPQPEERLTELQAQLNLDDDLSQLTEEPSSFAPREDSDIESSDAESCDGREQDADEGVSMPGVPHSPVHLSARRYATPGFATALLDLLQKDLSVPGWLDLPAGTDGSALAIHKVSGALTNAVFFVSAPDLGAEAPPTVLVRVYGPASDSLISRRVELHVLHTLSSNYGIGPAVFGTFGNGRVEQYFRSRALYKEEMRQPRICRWIARRMRELHSVPAEQMRPPDLSPAPGSSLEAAANKRDSGAGSGSLLGLHSNHSSSSLLSSSSQSSAFSFSSALSSSSVASSRSTSYAAPASPATGPGRPGFSESNAPKKRRSQYGFSDALGPASAVKHQPSSRPRTRERLGVWDNIARWTQEASRVLKAVEKLRPSKKGKSQQTPSNSSNAPASASTNTDSPNSTGTSTPGRTKKEAPLQLDHNPLDSASAMLAWKDAFDLPDFEKRVKSYRHFVNAWEKSNGKSKRVLCHNDTQYGNLLVRLRGDTAPSTPAQNVPIESQLNNPHEMIIVVDFEYAALNPRAYDIANHFIEWQADYHDEFNSHSLSCHLGPPASAERRTFYRAYIGADGGKDNNDIQLPVLEHEDQRATRLEAEVAVWEAASHAAWALWAVVQARDIILDKIDTWMHQRDNEGETETTPTTPTEEKDRPRLHRSKSGELQDPSGRFNPELDPTKSGSKEEEAVAQEADFDYLRYALERINMFRDSYKRNGLS